MRILCIGIGKEGSKYNYYSASASLPTIFDYDFIILDLRSYFGTNWCSSLSYKKNEFKKFFENSGICIVISERYEKVGSFSNYDWCPFDDKFSIDNRNGETIVSTDRRSKFLFDSVRFCWNHFFTNIQIEHKVLAVNRTKDALSIAVPYGSGCCVFLPTPRINTASEATTLLELLLSRGIELIPEIKEKANTLNTTNIPSWANLIASKKELTLLEDFNKISEKLGKYSKFKQLYWESGEPLENLVIDALSELGLKVDKLPKGSHADFEVKLDEDIVAVCETKGLMASASLQDLRQLLDYYIEQRDIEKRNVRGVFIVNHFRNTEPNKRADAVTKDALDLIRKHGFQLLTTIQIYELLERHWNCEVTKEYLMKLFAMRT